MRMEARKQDILKAVVREFAASAVPVGSRALVSRHFVNLSSATIRNELAELVDLGYLEQRHTSGGRIPTDRGYRYFVDFLMEVEEPVPPRVELFIESELRSAPPEPQRLVERVATTVAQVTGSAAVVSAPSGPPARIKHVDLVSLEPSEVLLIVLVEGNLLRQQVVPVSSLTEQTELSAMAARINHELVGQDREEVARRLRQLPDGLERQLLGELADALAQFEQGAGTLVVHDGVRNLLRQPEFAEASRLQDVLEVLEETRLLTALLHELARESDEQIVIGSEHQTEQLRSCTVVLTTYGPSGRLRGVVGAIGPTRMEYGRVVARLRAVARFASERMTEAV